jgi:hypothetical protein
VWRFEDDMDILAGIGGADVVHEVEELDAPTARLVSSSALQGACAKRPNNARGRVHSNIVRRHGGLDDGIYEARFEAKG